MSKEQLVNQLKRHEGYRQLAYLDSVNKLTVGYGRNLVDKGISREEAEVLLMNDLETTESLLIYMAPWIKELDEARKEAVLNMAFNMGIYGLLLFKKMIEALKAKDYERAAAEAMDSKWAYQVGPRAIELSIQIKTGQYKDEC